MTWNQYHRLNVIYRFMEDLAAEYPNICSVHEIGKSSEGRTIMVSATSSKSSSLITIITVVFFFLIFSTLYGQFSFSDVPSSRSKWFTLTLISVLLLVVNNMVVIIKT